MGQRVAIYMQESGVVAVFSPHPLLAGNDELELMAAKHCVPVGKPFKLIDADEVPADRTFREAWVVDPALLTDGVGEGPSDNFEWSY